MARKQEGGELQLKGSLRVTLALDIQTHKWMTPSAITAALELCLKGNSAGMEHIDVVDVQSDDVVDME